MGAEKKYYDDFQYEYIEEELRENRIKEDNKRLLKKKHAEKIARKQRARRLVFRLVLAVFTGVLAFALQIKHAKIASLNVELEQLNAIINESNDELMDLEARNEMKRSNIDIVFEARTKLGMTYANEDQEQYFSLKEPGSQDEDGISKGPSIFSGRNE